MKHNMEESQVWRERDRNDPKQYSIFLVLRVANGKATLLLLDSSYRTPGVKYVLYLGSLAYNRLRWSRLS